MKITVIGAGNSGLAMAAHLSYSGNEIRLWNRTPKTIDKIKKTKTINLHGIIEDKVNIDVITSSIEEAIEQSELILVTTPASSHRELGTLLGKTMVKDIPIILNPGRTFGAMNFYAAFVAENKIFKPTVAETQTIIYTCRKDGDNHVTIYSLKTEVKIAALNKEDTKKIISRLPICIKKYYKAADSFLETSLGNVGMVLHCVPFMLNTGWTECNTAEYKYYYDGITPTISKFIEHIDNERVTVGRYLGLDLETTAQWLKKEYHSYGSTLYECIKNNKAYKEIDAPKTIYHRYIFEDVPNGLVPVEKLGKELQVDTPYITTAINLANALLEQDFRKDSRYAIIERIKSFT